MLERFSVLGGLSGFLFGITSEAFRESLGTNQTILKTQPKYAANTNLEEISDWLTKDYCRLGSR